MPMVTPMSAVITLIATRRPCLRSSASVGDAEEIVKNVKRSEDASLTFHTNGIGDPHDVSLIPFFRIAHERYTLYWVSHKAG